MPMVEILSFVIKIVIGIFVIERKSLNLGIETLGPYRAIPVGTKCYRTLVTYP